MKLFEEVVPTGAEINASTIRNHTLAVAERWENELGDEQAFLIEGRERDWEDLPQPDLPLTVGIDGGYVDSCERKGKKDGRFEVIVVKSMVAEGESKCFGLVNSYDTKPKRRVFEALKSQGMRLTLKTISNGFRTMVNYGGRARRSLRPLSNRRWIKC
jgi:hypothetical protein